MIPSSGGLLSLYSVRDSDISVILNEQKLIPFLPVAQSIIERMPIELDEKKDEIKLNLVEEE